MSDDDDKDVQIPETKKQRLSKTTSESDTVTLSVHDFLQLQNNHMRYIQDGMKQCRELVKDKDEENDDHRVYFNVADCLCTQLQDYAWRSKVLLEKHLAGKPKTRLQYFVAINRFNEVLQECIGEKLKWNDETE